MTTSVNAQTPVRKPSKLETIKENSNNLREPLATELLNDENFFTEDAIQILKFHGSYQQDNRDNRVKGQQKDYQMMLRTRNPGGFIPSQLYLTLDRLSDEYGNGTLRATTRQGFQLHGVLKQNLKTVISAIVNSMGSTLGACGDLNRNVMAPAAPYRNRPEYDYARTYANHIADLLTPQTGAYYEIWLDGEKVISGEEDPEVKAARQRNGNGTIFHDQEEPIYGQHYMPRKFKCSVTVPGDNSIDLYTQDLSLVVITSPDGELEGFNIYAGGGLGRTHRKQETFPRLANEIAYVPKADVYDLVKAIVATQRDYSDRSNRRHARMKYLIEDWGVEKFKTQVEDYFGKPLQPFKPLPQWKYQDYLGWEEQGDGLLFVGISVENGRVKDEGDFRLKTALKTIVEQFQVPIVLSANHNILLYDIKPEDQSKIQQILDQHGVAKESEIDPLVRYAMACPAFPTCGLAIAESERAIPGILDRIRVLLDKVGLEQEHFVVRMTGCPNGCARPYVAELGFVGSLPGTYQVWLGGSPDQTRLAQPFVDRLPIDQLEGFLEPMFVYFKQDRQSGESFGDFCDRVGFDDLRQFVTHYQPMPLMNMNDTAVMPSSATLPEQMPSITSSDNSLLNQSSSPESETTADPNKIRHRVSVRHQVYAQLKEESKRLGKPVVELATAAIEEYLNKLQVEQPAE